VKKTTYVKSHKITEDIFSEHRALTILTVCVSGNSSATTLKHSGRSPIEKITPEKKNIGDRKPVK
jgi:hypothetical protein